MNNHPLSVKISFGFILGNILIWFGLGIIIALNAHPALPNTPLVKGLMAMLSIITAGILSILLILLYRGRRRAYFLMLATLVISALLIIFDDIGLVDVIVLILTLTPVILLIKDRAWYLQTNRHIEIQA